MSTHKHWIRRITFALFVSVGFCLPAIAQDARIELSQRMVNAANDFIDTLTRFQANQGLYAFDDEERLNWHFIPRDRNGVVLRNMSDDQLEAAANLLQTFFSASGFAQAEAVRDLENVLAEIEVNGRFERDPDLYYITIFGEPDMDSNWALRYEGHHLAFNWTFVRGLGIASSPQFFGTNPAEVRSTSRIGTRVLAAEEDLARSLVDSLDREQRAMAVIEAEVPRDIITSASKEVSPLEDSGIAYSQLDSSQRLNLMRVIEEVASVQPAAIFAARMAAIREQGLDAVRFTWIGSTERGAPHYYRVQGPGFLIEYDNVQNDANHIHLVWRDFTGDFGRDILQMHYDSVATVYGPDHNH
ncbi:MAG: DUF3500 domain-containing protein [Pseudomonadales bacterium]|nr:DUF3500 domain-containing protein [Pseudomonadales bacterium]